MRRTAMTLAAALTCFAVLTGCSDISAQLSGTQSSEPLESQDAQPVVPPVATPESEAAQPEASPESEPTPEFVPLRTVNWGTVDGLLSVVVVNPTGRTLTSAGATLTARDATGAELGTFSATTPGATCCTVADLSPGAAYGFYFNVGPDAAAVAEVEMSYHDVAWAAAEVATTPSLGVTPVAVNAGAGGTEVVVDVASSGPGFTNAVIQAFLVGPRGEFLAVVSGRWTCFAAGETRRVRMQLFHPVPEGTAIHSMVAHPRLGAGSTAPSCPV